MLDARCLQEVVSLHAFFERWFRGELQGEAALARVDRALAEDFTMVSPRGLRDDKESMLSVLRRAQGCRTRTFRITIEGMEVLTVSPPLCILTYEEHQQEAGKGTARITTAAFRETSSNPAGVEWVRVHETWAAPDQPAAVPGEGG
ncbi:MAG: DUF4440 domain-containing protein [Sandaracinaceae bacterium]